MMVALYHIPISISQLGPIFSIFKDIRKECTDDNLREFKNPDYSICILYTLKFDVKINFEEIKNILLEHGLDVKMFINVIRKNTPMGKSIRAHSYSFYFKNKEDASLFKLFL
jgi:hypothetical protein